MIVPDVRRHVLHDLHAGLGQTVHRVGCRRLDEVDRAGQQSGRARRALGCDHEDHAVGLGNTLGIPVGLVLDQLGALAWHQTGELERAGARRLRRELVPVLAELLELRRARHQEPEHLVGEERIDDLGLHLHGHVVDLLVARDRRQARPHLRGLALVELRRLGVEHLVEVPDHGVGVEGRSVVELHTIAQLEGPQGFVAVVDFPFGGEARDQLPGSVGDVHFPGDQRIVERVAGELVGAGPAIGLAGGERHVGHRDAEAHDLFVRRQDRHAEARGQGRQRAGAREDRTARKPGLGKRLGRHAVSWVRAWGDANATAWRVRRQSRRRGRWLRRTDGRRAGRPAASRRRRSRSTPTQRAGR